MHITVEGKATSMYHDTYQWEAEPRNVNKRTVRIVFWMGDDHSVKVVFTEYTDKWLEIERLLSVIEANVGEIPDLISELRFFLTSAMNVKKDMPLEVILMKFIKRYGMTTEVE